MSKKLLFSSLSFFALVAIVKTFRKQQLKNSQISEKYKKSYFNVSDWLSLKQRKINVSDYLREKNIKKVAIYGYGQIGKILYNDLTESGIDVAYAIDEQADAIYWDKVNILFPYEKFPEVDMIIISVFESDNKIKNNLKKFTNNKIIYLSDIIENLKND